MVLTQIVGPSGSGLTRELEKRYRETPGAVMLTANPRAHITYLRATVAEELAFGLEQRGIEPAQMWERVRKIGLGLDSLLDRAPAQLSGGQTRRLAIGAVAILEAPTMLLDDPFSGLDTSSRSQLITMLESYEGDVIVAAHKPWMDVPTTLLADLDELRLPPRVNTAGTPHEFRGIVGTRGQATRRWWQFSQPAPQFVVGPVDLTVRAGDVLWLQGENGSGKSTLLRAIADEPDTQLMLQNPIDQVIDSTVSAWVPGSTNEEHPLDLSSRDLRLAQADAALARAPRFLLADEPDVGLDTGGRTALHQRFATYLESGGTIVLTCHDESFVTEVSAYARVEARHISEL
ncbi:ATP-binding cassette domain-containing protein [Corynebacterium deserti]|uniref:ATP-binding cassette domain-containing protein n=1 Tax=Corynebacterium deserti TaxID=1408191 RepID=UPI0006AD41DB|nr:ATP-binding cassette domain-containing protein [Corynebacterium deserti]